MGIDQIVEIILKEAEEKATQIKEEAKIQKEKILEESRLKAEQKKQEILKEKERKLKEEINLLLTKANLEKKRIILDTKRKIIDGIFRALLERLDINGFPKIKKIFKDKVIEETLDKDDFLNDLKERLEKDLLEFLNLDEKENQTN